ncbi:MAG: hypothetical protein NTZ80_00260 [Patescibacteria group bacterium]|nr:hypothetical protein [Patescibacteria group bacterium]
MSELEKIKIAFAPVFQFEVGMGTFFDWDKFELHIINIVDKSLMEEFGQELFGDWCFPVKAWLALMEKAVIKDGVRKLMSPTVSICNYPMVMGNPHQWIKKDFEYYPIPTDRATNIPDFAIRLFRQLQKANPDLSPFKFVLRLPTATRRFILAEKMQNFYFQHLPLTRNPKVYHQLFSKFRKELVTANTWIASITVFDEFKKETKKLLIREKPTHKVIVSGDFLAIIEGFALFELDEFLAQRGVEILRPEIISYFGKFLSKRARKARSIIANLFPEQNCAGNATNYHIVEIVTLYHILGGIEDNAEGLIYIKPNMCAPCDRLSYVLKRENYFGLPAVEISYDEHSGVNGIITRLEAFLNIVDEQKK